MSDIDLVLDEGDEPVEKKAAFNIFSSEAIEQEFKAYIGSEINKAKEERESLIGEIKEWRRIANNEDTSGREPAWEGASDINVPAVPIVLKTATARLRNTFNARKPFWSIKALSKHSNNVWIQRSKVLEEYFNIISASRHDLNLYVQNNKIITDLPITGTMYVKVPYTNLSRNIMVEQLGEGGENLGQGSKELIVHRGPEVVPIRTEDALFRAAFQDVQKAPWFGLMHHMSWFEIQLLAENGSWTDVENLKGGGRTSLNDVESNDNSMRGTSSSGGVEESVGIWDIVEFWAYYDVNGDGVAEDILVYYHEDSDTILSAEYNMLGMRMIRNIPFYIRPNSLDGQSLVELSKGMQDEINSMHNLRNDGIHMTEAPVFTVKRGCGIRPKEKIRPGKMFVVDDPMSDMRLQQNSKQYVETASLEQLDYSYIERVTGISDIAGGFSSSMLKSRDTASSQSLRLQSGSEVFLGIIEGVDMAYQEIAEMLFRQLVANKEDVIAKEKEALRMSEEDITILEETLNVDIDSIPYALAFKARMVEDTETFEGRKQSIMALTSIYGQYIEKILPLMAQTYGPQSPMFQQMSKKFVEGSTALMEKVFIFFGQDDVGDFMTTSEQIEMMDQIGKQMQMNSQQLGGMQGAPQGMPQQQPQGPQGQPPQGQPNPQQMQQMQQMQQGGNR